MPRHLTQPASHLKRNGLLMPALELIHNFAESSVVVTDRDSPLKMKRLAMTKPTVARKRVGLDVTATAWTKVSLDGTRPPATRRAQLNGVSIIEPNSAGDALGRKDKIPQPRAPESP